MNNEQAKTPGRADVPTCSICRARHDITVAMILGQAIPEAVVNLGESQQTTGSHVGNAPMVDVWKCPECGHSFRCEAQTEGRPKKERALPTDGRYETVEDFMRASGISEDVQREVASSLPKSAEPVVEKEPSDDLLGGVISAWAAEPGLRNQVETLTSERDQLRKELEEANGSFPNKLMMWIVKFIEKHGWTPHPESIGWWGHPDYPERGNHIGYMFALEFMGEQFTRLKEELKHASELEQNERAIRVSFESELKEMGKTMALLTTENAALKERVKDESEQCVTYHNELTRLRSQFRWTPVPPEGITRTDERNKLVVWVSDSTSETGLEWLHGISRRATHYISIESLRQFLPLPSPPETEEQAMRREFEEWYQTTPLSKDRSVALWTAWQAAKQSTGGPA